MVSDESALTEIHELRTVIEDALAEYAAGHEIGLSVLLCTVLSVALAVCTEIRDRRGSEGGMVVRQMVAKFSQFVEEACGPTEGEESNARN